MTLTTGIYPENCIDALRYELANKKPPSWRSPATTGEQMKRRNKKMTKWSNDLYKLQQRIHCMEYEAKYKDAAAKYNRGLTPEQHKIMMGTMPDVYGLGAAKWDGYSEQAVGSWPVNPTADQEAFRQQSVADMLDKQTADPCADLRPRVVTDEQYKQELYDKRVASALDRYSLNEGLLHERYKRGFEDAKKQCETQMMSIPVKVYGEMMDKIYNPLHQVKQSTGPSSYNRIVKEILGKMHLYRIQIADTQKSSFINDLYDVLVNELGDAE